MENVNVSETLVGNELPRSYDLISAAFDTDDSAQGADTFGEKTEASSWTTTNLERLRALAHMNLTEQPSRIIGKFVSLALQSLLLCLSIS
jgi:hypothetical protein